MIRPPFLLPIPSSKLQDRRSSSCTLHAAPTTRSHNTHHQTPSRLVAIEDDYPFYELHKNDFSTLLNRLVRLMSATSQLSHDPAVRNTLLDPDLGRSIFFDTGGDPTSTVILPPTSYPNPKSELKSSRPGRRDSLRAGSPFNRFALTPKTTLFRRRHRSALLRTTPSMQDGTGYN